jgi:hypothetical protein
MRTRLAIAVVTAWVLGTPEVSHAQLGGALLSGAGTSVTLVLPVNLTQLSSDLERVRLRCGVASGALTWPSSTLEQIEFKDEVPAFGGQLVTTMKVMVLIPVEYLKDPIGKTADYFCSIEGFSRSLQRWGAFSETSTVPALLLKPAPSVIQGTFTW